MTRARQGEQSAVPATDTAERHPYTPVEREFVDSWLSTVGHGTPPGTVRTGPDRTGLTELLTTTIPDFEERARSSALVAGEFGLSARYA